MAPSRPMQRSGICSPFGTIRFQASGPIQAHATPPPGTSGSVALHPALYADLPKPGGQRCNWPVGSPAHQGEKPAASKAHPAISARQISLRAAPPCEARTHHPCSCKPSTLLGHRNQHSPPLYNQFKLPAPADKTSSSHSVVCVPIKVASQLHATSPGDFPAERC